MANWEGVEDVPVRILRAHEDTPGWVMADGEQYHEWITFGQRVKCNRLGIRNERICLARWTRWQCNNGDCGAVAFVSDDGVKRLLRRAERALP